MSKSPDEIVADYKEHLQKVFWHISKDPMINGVTGCYTVTKSSEDAFTKLKSNASTKYWSFKIDPPWILPIKADEGYFANSEASLVIGGEVAIKDSVFIIDNFYFSIIRNHGSQKEYDSCCESGRKEKNRVVRRFHFDSCQGAADKLEANNHVHFGGRLDEGPAFCHYVGGEELHYCLDSKLNPPRLPYPPLDIVLILDLLITQFQTPINKNFVNTKEWIALVRKSEDFRLKQYYREINKYYDLKEKNLGDKRTTLFETMCQKDFCS